ncbi:hypothetical protein [Aquipuribacter nitratireducens]|uniref:Uncharacterized protein n=1 Tax=Aquipuribacter nitratireducens TaxID=650104 RepID=A0ABW0GJN6_9MICO
MEHDGDAAVWARRLVDAGCVDEALTLEREDSAAALLDRALLALAGGSLDVAAVAVARLRESSGEVDREVLEWLDLVLAAARGEAAALPAVLARAQELHPSPAVDRLVLRAALGAGRADVAGAAADSVARAFPLDVELLAGVAAGKAAIGMLAEAVDTCRHCEALGYQGAGARAVDLLLAAGETGAAVQLAIAGARLSSTTEQRRVWRALASRVVPARNRRERLELVAGAVLFAVLVGFGGVVGGLAAAGIFSFYHRFLRPVGRDPRTEELVRAHRAGRAAHTRFPAIDALLGVAGFLAGLMGGAALLGHTQDPVVVATALLVPSLLLPVALVGGRRRLARLLARRAEQREQALRRRVCRCYGLLGVRGAAAREQLADHLVRLAATGGGARGGLTLLRCPTTGAHFIDVPGQQAVVAVPPRTERPVEAELPVGQYL